MNVLKCSGTQRGHIVTLAGFAYHHHICPVQLLEQNELCMSSDCTTTSFDRYDDDDDETTRAIPIDTKH